MLLCVGTVVLVGCTKAATVHTTASPTPAAAVGNEKVGAACSWLAGAEKRPVGSAQAVLGEAMLAHAGTLAIAAATADGRWAGFSRDMGMIGQPGGQPALDTVTAVCTQWSKDHTYYLKHSPPG